MKNLSLLFGVMLTLGSIASTVAWAALENGSEQKMAIASAECQSSFGNILCTGDYTCRQAAMENARNNHCSIQIKKIEAARLPDFMSDGIAYRSYSCNVVNEATCDTDLAAK